MGPHSLSRLSRDEWAVVLGFLQFNEENVRLLQSFAETRKIIEEHLPWHTFVPLCAVNKPPLLNLVAVAPSDPRVSLPVSLSLDLRVRGEERQYLPDLLDGYFSESALRRFGETAQELTAVRSFPGGLGATDLAVF